MPENPTRRTLLALGAASATAAVVGPLASGTAYADPTDADATTPEKAAAVIAAVYGLESAAAGGNWRAYITVARPDGTLVTAVDTRSAESVSARSTNKLAVAATVLSRVDAGQASLAQQLTVDESFVEWDGDGVIPFDGVYPTSIALGHDLSLMLSISEDTANALCSQIVTATEINEYLAAQGFTTTRVRTIPDSRRWYLGYTSAKEMHDLWVRLTSGTLVSAASSAYMLKILRCAEAFREGVRHNLTTPQRGRIATKAGWYNGERSETGCVYDSAGVPVVRYAMYADHTAGVEDFSVNNPLCAARARMGKRFVSIVDVLRGA